jgi:hypothetical protein
MLMTLIAIERREGMARARWTLALGVAAGAIMALSPGLALADAIDGNWCSTEGKRLSIEGPAIVTPAGTATHGNYSRHYFTYEVPPSDPGAGQTVYMALLNENTVHLTMAADAQKAQQTAVEVWHRCPPAVSLRLLPQTAS